MTDANAKRIEKIRRLHEADGYRDRNTIRDLLDALDEATARAVKAESKLENILDIVDALIDAGPTKQISVTDFREWRKWR